MKITVKIEVPDDEKCGHCAFYDEYNNGWPLCEIFGVEIENHSPCGDCIMSRFVENKIKQDDPNA